MQRGGDVLKKNPFWDNAAILFIFLGVCNIWFGARMVTKFNEIGWLILNAVYFFMGLFFILKSKEKRFYYLIPLIFMCMFLELVFPIPLIVARVFGAVVIAFGIYLIKWKLREDNKN
jgi:hypothetical protein